MEQATENALRKSPLFADLDDAALSPLLAISHLHKYNKRQMIFLHGDPAEQCYIVKQGMVKLFRENEQGDEVILEIAGAPCLLGETALVNDDGLYDYSAETIAECELITVPVKHLQTLLRDHHGFTRNMLRQLANKALYKDKNIELSALQEAPQRIGCFLLGLCRGQQSGPVTLTLPYEKTILAKQLGMRAETFSRALSKLQADLALDMDGATIKVPEISALIRYTCAACSESFPCRRPVGK